MRESVWSAVLLLTVVVQVPVLDGRAPGLAALDSHQYYNTLEWQSDNQWQLAGNTACNPRAQICDRVDEGSQR